LRPVVLIFGHCSNELVIEGFEIKKFGFITEQKKMIQIYGASDVFVSLAQQESFGLTVIESILCGSPAVVLNHTGCSEIVEKTHFGVICPPEPQVICSQISYLLDNPPPRPPPEVLNEFSLDFCTKSYLKLYQDTLGNKAQ
jgi:putative colanic acid biosynthesis glycosyltransferase